MFNYYACRKLAQDEVTNQHRISTIESTKDKADSKYFFNLTVPSEEG
jgi:hypothetical protein